MINLIPPAARRSVIKEYWLRVSAVWMFLFGTGFLVVSAFLLPTYVQISTQMNGVNANSNSASEKIATYDTLVAELKTANTRAQILTSQSGVLPLSSYITKIEQTSGTEVTINSYAYEMKAAGEVTINISGIASTRGALASFRDTLSTNPLYSKVELPISNLIKDRDLLFSMQLSLASSTPEI